MNAKILVIDDTDQTRDELVSGLLASGFTEVMGVRSGEEAIQRLMIDPESIDVAVIDHVLREGTLDGIQTTREICKCSLREIFPIVFTNLPTDSPETIRRYRNQAYQAGAYRYMYRGDQGIKQVTDFVREIQQLRQLREKVRQFYDSQQHVPSLLSQLDIMVTLIDRTFRIWYRNPAADRFQKVNRLPCQDCPLVPLSITNSSPCLGCLVNATLESGKSGDGVYLQSMGRGRGLRYFGIRTQAVGDDSDPSAPPIAVLQSVEDLTESERLRATPTEDRLSIIARGLFQSPNGFDRVRIYKKTKGKETLELVCALGYKRDFKKLPIGLRDYDSFKVTIDHFKANGEGRFFSIPDYRDNLEPTELKEKFIHWPLMKGEKLLGLISVNGAANGRPCTPDGLDTVKDYADEALRVLEMSDSGGTNPEVENAVAEIDRALVLKRTPEELLRTLLSEMLRLTDTKMVHIRYRDEDGMVARLLPIGFGEYFKVAPSQLQMSGHHIAGIRVMKSGVAESQGSATKDPAGRASLQTLPSAPRKVLESINSFCIQPLKFEGQIIGSVALYSKSKDHYDESKILIAENISERIAPALHDYLVKIERSKEKDELLVLDARRDLAHRAVHNLRNPAAAAHAFLVTLKRDFDLEPKASEIVNHVESQIIRIEELVNSFLWYLKPIRFRVSKTDLGALIQSVINHFLTTSDVQIELFYDTTQTEIIADRESLVWVIEELLENARKMEAAKIEVRVTFASEHFVISIANDGLPVPNSIAGKLFEPFQSSDPTGTGLGLANVKKILEEHNGTIELDASYTHGARFVLRLPFDLWRTSGEHHG